MKKVISIMLAFLFMECRHSPSHEGNLAKAQQLFESFNDHNWLAMADLYASEASFLDPSYGIEFVTKSKSEIISKYEALEEIFPDIKDEIQGIYASGDKVIVEFISTGTSADGMVFTLPIISVLTFSNGLIIKDATYYDQ